LSNEEFVEIVHARARRRFQRGLKRRPMGLIKKLRKAKKEAPPNEKPAVVKTHLRDMIIVPEMIGSVVGIYNGKVFNSVEIKPEMVGHYLGEFSVSYKPVKHGRPGIGATHCKLSVAFMICTVHHFLSFCARTASRLYVSSCPFQLLVTHIFPAFPSSNCTPVFPLCSYVYCTKENYALCVVLVFLSFVH
jgi:small subunit ribosomal protein S15e